MSESIFDLYDIAHNKNKKFSTILAQSPIRVTNSMFLFPVYHFGARGTNINRPLIEQINDWRRIGKWLHNYNPIK